jgi:hypothetical protein
LLLFYFQKPTNIQPSSIICHDLQMEKVFEYLTHISKEPHSVRSQRHKAAQDAIVGALQSYGVKC